MHCSTTRFETWYLRILEKIEAARFFFFFFPLVLKSYAAMKRYTDVKPSSHENVYTVLSLFIAKIKVNVIQ